MTEFTVGQSVWVRSSGEAPPLRGTVKAVTSTGYQVTIDGSGDIFDCYPGMLSPA